jgi:hypothetical protein
MVDADSVVVGVVVVIAVEVVVVVVVCASAVDAVSIARITKAVDCRIVAASLFLVYDSVNAARSSSSASDIGASGRFLSSARAAAMPSGVTTGRRRE